MEYRCRLAAANGQIIEQTYVADNEARLRRELEDKGLYVLSLHAKGSVGGVRLLPGRTSIRGREFLVFNQELATLLKAGIPLVQALDLLKRRTDTPAFRTVLDDVYERVRGGAALSDAFDAHRATIPSVYTASLVAGERSGNLEAVLRRYVDYAKTVALVRRKMRSALFYPAILLSLSIGLVSFIIVKVVPAFTDFYESFGSELPAATRLLMTGSAAIRHHIFLLLLIAVAAIAAVMVWLRSPEHRLTLDRWLLRVPLAGDIARKFATSQMARTLATLLGGGLPLVNAIEIAARTSGHSVMVSGLAVTVAMAGLYLAGDANFASLATGGVLVVLVAVLGSLTVLPALLAKLTSRIDRPRVPVFWRL
ncbi:MAG: type II secretion system F family protein, partial [Acidobacteriaceae bacterium]|nr:type II secretion system F family protein [Acidobacteriaceae bacterium]